MSIFWTRSQAKENISFNCCVTLCPQRSRCQNGMKPTRILLGEMPVWGKMERELVKARSVSDFHANLPLSVGLVFPCLKFVQKYMRIWSYYSNLEDILVWECKGGNIFLTKICKILVLSTFWVACINPGSCQIILFLFGKMKNLQSYLIRMTWN